MIRKEANVSRSVMEELRRVILDSEIMKEDDKLWPQANRDGRQELEIIYGGEHICFSVIRTMAFFIFISFVVDCKDWVAYKCTGQPGPRGPPRLLLSSARPEIPSLRPHLGPL